MMTNFELKFQTLSEKTAKNFRGLLFAAPCTLSEYEILWQH